VAVGRNHSDFGYFENEAPASMHCIQWCAKEDGSLRGLRMSVMSSMTMSVLSTFGTINDGDCDQCQTYNSTGPYVGARIFVRDNVVVGLELTNSANQPVLLGVQSGFVPTSFAFSDDSQPVGLLGTVSADGIHSLGFVTAKT